MVVAVGSVGARSLIRARLCAIGFVEGPDFVVAAYGRTEKQLDHFSADFNRGVIV